MVVVILGRLAPLIFWDIAPDRVSIELDQDVFWFVVFVFVVMLTADIVFLLAFLLDQVGHKQVRSHTPGKCNDRPRNSVINIAITK